MTDRDPCQGCTSLAIREGIRPYCIRGAQYGQLGCVRKVPRGPMHQAPGHDGDLSPETARRELERQRKQGGRRGR